MVDAKTANYTAKLAASYCLPDDAVSFALGEAARAGNRQEAIRLAGGAIVAYRERLTRRTADGRTVTPEVRAAESAIARHIVATLGHDGPMQAALREAYLITESTAESIGAICRFYAPAYAAELTGHFRADVLGRILANVDWRTVGDVVREALKGGGK